VTALGSSGRFDQMSGLLLPRRASVSKKQMRGRGEGGRALIGFTWFPVRQHALVRGQLATIGDGCHAPVQWRSFALLLVGAGAKRVRKMSYGS
jgi:hypothetical protein